MKSGGFAIPSSKTRRTDKQRGCPQGDMVEVRPTSEGRPGEHHPSLPEVRQGQDHQGKGPPSHRPPHRDRQIAGQREQSHDPRPRRAITLPSQKTSTRHSHQQRRNKDSRRKPGPLLRHNETAEQIDTHRNHHDPDEPLDQTIWVTGGHTRRNILSHTAKLGANRHIERHLGRRVDNPSSATDKSAYTVISLPPGGRAGAAIRPRQGPRRCRSRPR